MQIAICDDEKNIRELISDKVKKQFPEVEIDFYSSGDELLLSDKPMDILFLDIQMSGRNGMETARELRKKNKQTIIIFVTAIEEYVFQAFDVGAFHYIIKPIDDEKFTEVLCRAVDELEEKKLNEKVQEENHLLINNGGVHIKVKIDDIIYAEVFNRKVVIHKMDETIEYYGKMSDLETLAGESFFRPHRAYLINFKYVEKYDASTIYLEKGTALMAKQNYSEFVKKYMKYNQKRGYLRMNNIETYWAIVSHSTVIINYLLEGWLVYRYVKPFMKNKPHYVGIGYSVVMLLFFCIPQEITYPNLQGALAAWIAMCILEKKKIKQKAFLAISMYLFRWVVYGVTLVLRDIMFALFIETPYMWNHPIQQVIMYAIVELVYFAIALTSMYLVIKLIHKVYVNKKEDITEKELLLLFATMFSVMLGYFSFNFFSNVYIEDTEMYIWNVHPEYTLIRVLYQLVSFVAILIAIVSYQKLKENQREEKENVLLAEQIANTKQHISEIEKLYGDIRALKHDMGNHISVLENLFLKNEKEELEKYMAQLKASLNESVAEIKTGNPVTDMIINQKKKEADEKGIQFEIKFVYPMDTNINAFDISVILNNAIENAFEGVSTCEKPYVSILSYRKKNAYMLEIANCISRSVEVDTETGLPETTKQDKLNHGYGLVNIRKVAQKYYGDIDISQEENKFTLMVMLMID